MTALHLSPGRLTLDQLRSAWIHPVAVTLERDARARIDAAADAVAGVIAEGRIVYGVNTGFGLLARTHIDATRLAELQRALVLSHSAGTGPPLDDAVVRLTLLLKIASLARGYSGVRYEVVDALLKLLNTDVIPVVPSQGSVGASGDLAPLAHLAGVLIGEGQARVEGRTMSATKALMHAGIAPLRLAAKEGLALLNGTQVSTALALAGLFAGERVFAAARSPVRSRWTPASAATRLSTSASRRSADIAGRRTRRACCASSSLAAPSAPRTATARASRIRTACAASRRSWVPASTRCAAPGKCCSPRPTPYRIILSCFRKRARCSLAEISTASRWRLPRMAWRLRSPRSARCPSGAPRF